MQTVILKIKHGQLLSAGEGLVSHSFKGLGGKRVYDKKQIQLKEILQKERKNWDRGEF